MDITVIVLAAMCAINLLLGGFVLLKNKELRAGSSLILLLLLFTAWSISSYFTQSALSAPLNALFQQLAYFFSVLGLCVAAVFVRHFTQGLRNNPRLTEESLLLVAFVVSAFSTTSYIAGTVVQVGEDLVFDISPLIGIYYIIVFLVLTSIVWDLMKLLRSGDRKKKYQAGVMIAGFSASMLIGLVTNVFIPSITHNFASAQLGPPLFSFLLISIMVFALIRHSIFDIRLIVARSVAYFLSLGLIAAVFSLLIFGISGLIIDSNAPKIFQQLFYVVVTLALVLTYPNLKGFFDRVTNKMFYRDAYDSQELLNSLNTSLVATIDLDQLLRKSARIISGNLHTEFCAFAVYDSHGSLVRFVPDNPGKITQQQMQQIKGATREIRHKVIVAEDLSSRYLHVKGVLEHNRVAMFARLQHAGHSSPVNSGFMLLGPKLSGGVYSAQDIKLIEIITAELVIAIQNALRMEQIEHFNATLQQKVAGATKDLRKANERLRALDKAKDEFVSLASHNLRTPLTSVKGYLSMLLDGDGGKLTKQQKILSQKAFDGSERMVFLISDLLNISRLQGGTFTIESTPMDLAKMVEKEVEQLQETAKSHELKLIFRKPDDFPKKLMLDNTKTRQVVMNFLDNAIFYTPKGGSVEVALKATDKEIIYTVSDTGLGVPKSEQHHLFSKFYRAENARKMRPDGTGLGLYMAKKVVVAQGGAVIVHSEEGKGSTFGFSFPKRTVESKQ